MCLVTQSCPTLCDPMNCSLPGSSAHGNSQARTLEWVASPFSSRSSQPGDQTQVSCIASRFFTSSATWEAPIKSLSVAQSCPTLCDPMDCSPPGFSVYGDSPGKNTRVGCHALLWGIFPTQGLNPGLPNCRRIFYHLSHQRSP